MSLQRRVSRNTSACPPAGSGDPHFKPRLSALLQTLQLDVSYERGSGDCLYYRDPSGEEVEVLDFVGGYGSLLLGHSHPLLVEEATRLLLSGRPIHSQGSRRVLAEKLAGELSRRAGGDYCVVFGNSGAEAVEAALKHAILETGSRTFIVLEKGFHGKTLGALQLTGNPEYREGLDLAGLNIIRVPLNDLAALEAAFASAPDLAGFIYEPLQGEGGIHLMERAFAARASQLCAEHGAALIADECQSGMGRTGTFLASAALGIQPDYVILSKALGGGIAKISALLVRRERYADTFDLKHTSTYAEDDFSCAIALKTLELLDDDVIQACKDKGDRLLARLRELSARYPGVIAGVRGLGLMLAVEFHRQDRSRSFLLRFLSSQEDLGYVLASYFLRQHRIRVAPTLSDRFSLRLEPSALVSEEAVDRLVQAMERLCRLLANHEAVSLTRHFSQGATVAVGGPLPPSFKGLPLAYDTVRFQAGQVRPPEIKVAWLCHMVDASDLASLEPSFHEMTLVERERLLARWASRSAPVVMGSTDVRSRSGEVVRFYPIMLPFTSGWVKKCMEDSAIMLPRTLVQQGVDAAVALGCQMVSLGQYTSIVTLNGLTVLSGEAGVTTGNSYAIALALQALEQATRGSGRCMADSVLVVAGAAGNIGRTCAEILAPHFRRTLLTGSGRPGSGQRLQTLATHLPRTEVADHVSAMADGDVVVVALNAVDTPIHVEQLAYGAIVCDLSVPAGLNSAGLGARPDVVVIKGGIAALPFDQDLAIPEFPLPAGQVYGCMAEAMLLGFEGVRDREHTGTLTPGHVARVTGLAARHGFALAGFQHPADLRFDRKESSHALIPC